MRKHYKSIKLKLTIARPAEYLSLGGGVSRVVNPLSIEFKGGRFSTEDEEVQAHLESRPNFGKDFFLLQNVAKAAVAAAEPEAAPEADEDEDEIEFIDGVTNRNKALAALAERGVDPSLFGRNANKAAIKMVAEEHGFAFTDW